MDLTKKHCVPCDGGTPPMQDIEEDANLPEVSGWKLDRTGTHTLSKQFIRKNFKQAIAFVNAVADLAEREGHHPNIFIKFNHVAFTNYTHAANGLTENDFILAAKIDALEREMYP